MTALLCAVGLVLGAALAGLTGCSSGGGNAVATETDQAEYDFWTNIAKQAVDTSVTMLNTEAGRGGGKPEMIVLTSAGYAMIGGHTTEACLDGLRENANVSEGKQTLLSVHASVGSPLWFFIVDTGNGNGVYAEVNPDALNLTDFSVSGGLFGTQNLRNVKAENLFADMATANETIFNAKAFNGNEFRLIGITNLLMEDGPYDLVRSVQYHDHYCPGVTSGYFLVRYLEKNLPLTGEFGAYFVLSVPPWCKDDAIMTLLNATPGKSGYGVAYLNAQDKATLRSDAQNIAGVFFRWNGDSAAPAGDGMALTFDFAEAKAACNWGEDTPWNWWESRLKMDLWYLDYLSTPERFITALPVDGKTLFSLDDLDGVSVPSDLDRPGVNPLAVLGLTNAAHDDEYALWRSVGKRAAEEGLALMKTKGASPSAANLIVLSNAGYAEIDGRTTQGFLDGLTEMTGASRGRNRLLEIHSHPDKALYAALYDMESGLCAYAQVNPFLAAFTVPPSEMAASDIFSILNVQNIDSDYLFANPAEAGARFDEKIFGGNEFAVVTIANAVVAGAPAYAVRSFEFHDHYCPGVTSGIMMAQYVKRNFAMRTPSDAYFVQGIQPWCKEDALMVMLNATPGKSGYAVSYPTNDDKAKWLPEAANVSTIVYRKNGETGLWDGIALAYAGGATGCPSYGNTVIDKLCADLWYLERMDQPETFISVVKEFQLPQGVEPKAYARPGVDPMEMVGLTVQE